MCRVNNHFFYVIKVLRKDCLVILKSLRIYVSCCFPDKGLFLRLGLFLRGRIARWSAGGETSSLSGNNCTNFFILMQFDLFFE